MNSYTLLAMVQCLLMTSDGASIANRGEDINFINMSTLLYTGSHDIVNLGVSFSTELDQDTNEGSKIRKAVFFIEADINENGDRVDHGLFVLKNGVKTKLLDNARDITVVNASNPVYFASKDGIYVYNEANNTAQKYGTVNDQILSIAAEHDTGVVYFLNKQHQLYKVTEEGNKYSIVDTVKDAEQIVTDTEGNIFYYKADKTIYVYDRDEVRKIEGVPNDSKTVKLIKSPLFYPDTAIAEVDDKYYVIFASNGTAHPLSSESTNFKITAVSIDMGFLVYYTNDKKIYEFDVLSKVLEALFEGISKKIESYLKNVQL